MAEMMKRNRNKLALSSQSDQPWVDVEFASTLAEAASIEKKILAECESLQFAEMDMFGMKLALEEALVNAVKHGNKMDSTKHVRVHYRISPQRMDVTIEDEGPGFDPSSLPDPTAEENLERCCGRGILLMRAYMSSVVFSSRGNKVTLTKFNENYIPPKKNVALA